MRIKSVTLDGANFTTFDPITRTLNIAANQGGKFYVTYETIYTTPTAIPTVENTKIKVYPNPTNGPITIEGLENASKVSVVDLTGKVMLEEQVSGKTISNMDIQSLNQGIYFVVINQNSGVKVIKKVVKQ